MSDQWGPGGNDDHGGDGQPPPTPPPPPPGQAPVEPDLTLGSEGEVTSGGVGGRAIAGIVGVLLLVGGTVFAVTQLGSSDAGSPEEAVSRLVDAAADEDVLGLVAALDPNERDALRDPVEDIFEQLERLEVLDDSFQLDGVDGVDFTFEDVTYRTESVRDDLARVYFTGGTVTSSLNSDEIPIGDFVSDTLERFGGDIGGVQESSTTDITDAGDFFLVARDGSDGWRVSLAYTTAEAARLSAGLPMPDEGVEPIGAESPEAAVESMFEAVADFDVAGIIARLSPDELGALQDYAGLFLDMAAGEARETTEDVDVTIDDLSLRSEGDGDRASVFVEGFGLTVTTPDFEISASYADECFSVEGDLEELGLGESPFADGPVCADDAEALMGDFYGTGMLEDFELDLPEFPAIDSPTVGITTAKVDGEWYVAPIATGMDAMVAGFASIEREHLEAMVDLVEQVMSSFQDSFTQIGGDFGAPLTEEFEGIGEEIGETTTTIVGTTTETIPDTVDGDPLTEFVYMVADDEAHGDCILGELEFVDDTTRTELAESYQGGYEPSQETQDEFIEILEYCRGA